MSGLIYHNVWTSSAVDVRDGNQIKAFEEALLTCTETARLSPVIRSAITRADHRVCEHVPRDVIQSRANADYRCLEGGKEDRDRNPDLRVARLAPRVARTQSGGALLRHCAIQHRDRWALSPDSGRKSMA